jgi:hypothetical protein
LLEGRVRNADIERIGLPPRMIAGHHNERRRISQALLLTWEEIVGWLEDAEWWVATPPMRARP